MAVTDLTNTTWYVPSGWHCSSNEQIFDVVLMYDIMSIYENNGVVSFDSLSYGNEFRLGEDDTPDTIKIGSSIATSSYNILVKFTSGSSMTDETLISWLETNGTQLKVSDLTDTTWNVPAGWEATAGYVLFDYHFQYTMTFSDGTSFGGGIDPGWGIGYTFSDETFGYVPATNKIGLPWVSPLTPTQSFSIHFEDNGSDNTNPKLIAWLSKYGELQEKITDLTGYTVTVPSGWTVPAGYGTIYIISYLLNGSYYGSYIELGFNLNGRPTTNTISFDSEKVVTNTQPFTLDIAGGVGASSSQFIQWLYDNNATFTKEGEDSTDKLTDLTGTKWIVGEGWEASSGYGQFDVVGTVYNTSQLNPSPYFVDGFNIGYLWTGDGDRFWITADSDVICDDTTLYFQIYSNDSFEITITGGNDVKDTKLIDWLYKYGEFITEEPEEPEQPEEPTPTKKFTRLYIGEIVKTIGNKVFRKLQITAPIKFTIGGTEYQAEPSMTFGEWLESGYNTSDYYTKTITSDGVEYNPIIIAEDGDVFTVVETKGAIIEVGTPITADAEYTTVILTQDSALQAGLYDANDNLVASWDELVNTYGMNPTISYSSSSSSSTYYKTCKTSPYYVLTKNSKLSSGVKLVIGNIGTSIPSRLFFECEQLTDIIVPEGVKTLSSYCFGQCAGLKNITLPNTITSVSNHVFCYCENLLELIIPDGVTKLSNQMCIGCESLKSVVIPSTVTSIGTQTFSWCYDLGDITFKGTVSQWNSITFDTSWKQSVPATQVVCSDGTVTLRN